MFFTIVLEANYFEDGDIKDQRDNVTNLLFVYYVASAEIRQIHTNESVFIREFLLVEAWCIFFHSQ